MIALVLLLAAASPTACAAPAVLSPAFAGWATPADHGPLVVGTPLRLRLSPGQSFAVTTGKPPLADSSGIAVPFTIERAGTYDIALSDAAWLDVVAGGKALRSASHRHGPDCSGIRKIVSFSLAPGTYILQVSNSDRPSVTAEIVPASH